MGISSKLITRFQSGFMHNRFIGDHGFACRLIMEDASKSTPISGSLGVMLDQTKAYDRIHPEYLCKVLNRFGFPNKFIKRIHDLFFGNSISVNVNGSLSDSIQQLRGLRQGDSISPILFNLTIEPFLLSILHNEIIDGYCLKARRFNSDLQLTAPRPVKLLAYADDILIFINSKEEFLELQERLKVYNGASNSQATSSILDTQYGSPTINELYSIKKPSASLKARIARTTLEQPKNKGGVSLLNVEVQQKIFQFRYINPLLLNCRQRIPDFLYKMLIFTLQSSFDAPSHVIPLIFKHSRSYSNMKGLHPLIPMFSALDSCPRLSTENDLTISSQTSLLIPFKDICEEDPQEKFKFSKFLQAQKAYHFFEQDFLSNGIQFKSRQHYGSPNILQKIKNAVLTGNLIFKPYFASLLSAEQQDLELDNEEHPTEPNINFDPFIQQMSYEDINITALKNRQLKTMFSFNSNSQITNISPNNWKAFISSPMHHIPRNVWYRLRHKKLSTRANLHRIIPAKVDDDYFQLCKLPKTEQHMLFTCIQKQDLWNAAFKKYLSNPKDPNCSSIFEDLSTLRLSKYYILHYHDKFTIYDFFATVIRFIWKAHWQQFFKQTPVVDEIVINQIQKELLKLSAYNSLC
ncbi:hypothetical protein RO3G_16108 [Rhizopus delemar RA 99-880]|uniref:Reverse transcriptase domain-containing protein n=1 Tax=Rhizopus delemar (strain RA 99-880 / ATCC MYA-4621 / FGSC 9543 / NRRL 43880) TaxID=246409 RepID=I1CSG7_RHIO9|nr:hypothetical protein RO3G_16108 [Rhizopus delemar RA 99-880]|eukprot:EIE91397.1 hypothetical protein RO3G_16108 [Rhizopus delemar RA 99-880]